MTWLRTYLAAAVALRAAAQSTGTTSTDTTATDTTSITSTSDTGEGLTTISGTRSTSQIISLPTSYTISSVVPGLPIPTSNASETATGPQTVTYLTGTVGSSSTVTTTLSARSSSSATSSSSAATATSTQICNGHAEFCSRKYSNITMVGAHNSPFTRKGSVASNQQLDVTQQLNDGVRFLQAQMQFPTNSSTPHFCHTTCDLLDAGPIEDWLGQVKDWVAANRNEVVTILLGNGQLANGTYLGPLAYAPSISASGILQYVYRPVDRMPVTVDDWPTLDEMILSNRRVVMFMDYGFNLTQVPWLMDEFTCTWETPYDPTDPSFPCTVNRPPGLSTADSSQRMYIMNHNLNTEISLLGSSLTVPAITALNVTNAASGNNSLGMAAQGCLSDHNKPPNVLNVDYYNIGSYSGSVFEVAALMNNVTYSGGCCGSDTVASLAHRTGMISDVVTPLLVAIIPVVIFFCTI